MFTVEVIHQAECGDELLEKANIPCAGSLDEAKRIVRQWLACRCSISHKPTHARLLQGETEMWSQSLVDTRSRQA
jgi:hypothetical protein